MYIIEIYDYFLFLTYINTTRLRTNLKRINIEIRIMHQKDLYHKRS
ncbi:MAG: hypothetical protein ACJAS1_004685 [Oleiphilaceae bacterium]|jgi:hypothetical protein